MKIATFQNRTNRDVFVARIVEYGDKYGKDFMLIHYNTKPMIEFYDPKYKFDILDGVALGHFITRYYVEDFISGKKNQGIDLMGGVEGWALEASTVTDVAHMLVRWELIQGMNFEPTESTAWESIPDVYVRHIWANEDGEEISVSPDFYEHNGEPCNGETGEVMTYLRTEILK